ncbi:NUDIX hydrolase [Myxococcota bacterium]|nr:NUDIX hydrolase [Myxococcota bacterium]
MSDAKGSKRESFEERFRRHAQAAKGTTPEVRQAATVILVRDTEDGLETLMLRRNSKLDFVGGMWVFPGGRLDPEDWRDDGDLLAASRRAAVREAQEEAGLRIDEESLATFSHWEPPPITPKRFMTWFFIAPAPAGKVIIDDGEIHDSAWMRPADALVRRDANEIELAPPTWVTLNELSRHADVAQAMTATRAREPEAYSTRVAPVEGGVVAMWHGDAGYEAGDADLPGARHRLWMLDTDWRYERGA